MCVIVSGRRVQKRVFLVGPRERGVCGSGGVGGVGGVSCVGGDGNGLEK